LGRPLASWWRANLGDAAAAHALLERLYAGLRPEAARQFGGEVIHRVTLFGFTLLTLFFLFRDGDQLADRLTALSRRLLGPDGERIFLHMVAAVHGTVNGLVLVGLGEGALLGFGYALAGLPHPVSIGALTGVLAVIPFGAPFAFAAAALYLMATGSGFAAVGILIFGLVVVFVADHFVRPVLIGGAIRLPFLWVLLGILGGLETFGLLGLFLGPAVMAALISLWRDWTETAPRS
jgi:predicted PurR-regulated permease PerM